MSKLEQAVRDTVNGLRADLHDYRCPGMDEDGNWLGPCACAKQHKGMPAIIFSDEAHRTWMEILDSMTDGYYARVRILAKRNGIPEKITLEGQLVRTERVDSLPALVLGLAGGTEVVLPAEIIESVYLY